MKGNHYLLSGAIGGLAAVAVYLFGGELLMAVVCGLVAFGLFALLLKPQVQAPAPQPTVSIGEIVAQGEASLEEIDRLADALQDDGVKGEAREVTQVVRRILQTLREKSENVNASRKFFSYYLPTLKGLLARYGQMEKNGVSNDELRQKLIGHLDGIQNAMNKFHENLYQRDVLDMSVEMEVMTRSCIQDGLLTQDDIHFVNL